MYLVLEGQNLSRKPVLKLEFWEINWRLSVQKAAKPQTSNLRHLFTYGQNQSRATFILAKIGLQT
jgi:hypothetical protein